MGFNGFLYLPADQDSNAMDVKSNCFSIEINEEVNLVPNAEGNENKFKDLLIKKYVKKVKNQSFASKFK